MKILIKMDFNEKNENKWRSTDSNSDFGYDDSITEKIDNEFDMPIEKNFDNCAIETICDKQNDNDDKSNIVVVVEEGLLNAMNNLKIASVKKLQNFRNPIIAPKNNHSQDDKKNESNEISDAKTVLSKTLEPEIQEISNTAMKLFSMQPSNDISTTLSTTLQSKSTSRHDVSMNQSISKHTVKTILSTKDGIKLKEEKINFFGIPVTADRKQRTQVIPFNFQNRTKKKQVHTSTAQNIATTKSSSTVTVPKIKSNVKSLQLNAKINNTSKISNNKIIAPNDMKRSLSELGQTKFQNNAFKNVTLRKFNSIISQNKIKTDKENNMPDNNIIETQEIKLKSIPIGPKLHTDKRAKDRQEFDAKLRKRELEIELMRARVEEKKREKEKIEIQALRKKLITKAKPMPEFKVPPPIYSNKPLTEPQSPAWALKSKRPQ